MNNNLISRDDLLIELRKLKRNPYHSAGKRLKSDCERFFISDWYKELTSVDGKVIMERIRKEVIQ